MKNYIILTGDGFTYDKNEDVVENLQVVDFISALSKEDAMLKIKEKHSEYLFNHFDNFIIYKLDDEMPSYT